MLCSAHDPLDCQRKSADLCGRNLKGMFFKTHSRINPATGQVSIYYRLVENNRNALGGISQRSIMGVGFLEKHLSCKTNELFDTHDKIIILDLRPIFYKTDDAAKAHIHSGLMAYWVVNTIRSQLKGKGINNFRLA